MSEDASEQMSLDEIVDDHSEGDIRDKPVSDDTDHISEGNRVETSIGSMPADWDVSRLCDICEINPDGFSEDDWEKDTFEYISLSDVSEGKILRSETTLLDEAPSRAQRRIKAGDVLVGTVRPKQISHGFVTEEHDEKICSSGFGVLRTDSDLSGYYLLQEVLSHRFFRQMEAYVAGSGYPAVKIGDLKKHKISVPSIPEQRKIASVLYNVDKAIQKIDEILAQLDRIKLGLYQQLFFEGYDQHDAVKSTKYGNIPESWELEKLSKISSQIQAGGTPDSDVPEYYGGSIPWIKTGELSQSRITDTEEYISEKGLENSTARIFEPGTVLIAMYGATTGEVSLLELEATSNQACCGVATTDKLQSEFLYHQLQYLSSHLKSLSAGSGQQNISKGIIEKFDVIVPPIEEQESIVDVLNNVDDSILKNEQAKYQYERLKRGLMQDLLSGEVRTHGKDIEILPEIEKNG